ncbi:Zinc finger, CCHC domain-containing protein [Dissophora globulifera]|uniref:polynucleotide adenylyltransferase n=1 Tax=Dissophora globulifera TaxID=979702 RepID=A0A9P6RNL1_9FUNG|nr:Zinc finger, CCHC domain-containing protein [Dissophora globulifera]KAG0324561.1 Zinc finger, CCHC domain-containing protein [Dissophora globulifera]
MIATSAAAMSGAGMHPYIQQLTDDMVSLSETIAISEEGTQLREGLITRVQGILNTEWPKETKIECFGSFASGLGTDSSDVDLVILPALLDQDQTLTSGRFQDLFTLKTLFQRYSMKDVEVIQGARVPILKFTDHKTGIKVDLNYGHYTGLYNTRLTESYVRIDDRVRAFLYVLKAFVKARGINSPELGSLSSYCYTLMAISYFQTLLIPVLPCLQDPHLIPHNVPNPGRYGSTQLINVAFTDPSRIRPCIPRNSMTLGELFIGFLEYYGSKFEYTKSCVSIRCGGVIPRDEAPSAWARHAFVVEDPFILDFNAAGAKKDMMNIIRHEFQAAVQALRDGRGLSAILTKRRPHQV